MLENREKVQKQMQQAAHTVVTCVHENKTV